MSNIITYRVAGKKCNIRNPAIYSIIKII